MATVTGYTAARMKQIEDASIIDGDVVGDDLILTRFDTTQVNAGNVRGAQGVQGSPGTGIQVVTSTTRPVTPIEGNMIYETDTDKFLSYNGTEWVLPKNLGEGFYVVTSTTRPVNPGEGTMIYETDTDRFLTYNGTTWVLPKNVASTNFGGYVEPLNNLDNVSGTVVLDFATHNVWRIVPTGAVNISFLNLPVVGNISSGTIIVANSSYAMSWPTGTKFANGAPPTLSGETYLSLLARSTHVTVGSAWTAVA